MRATHASRNWDALVKQGRKLVADEQAQQFPWKWGDLALQVAPIVSGEAIISARRPGRPSVVDSETRSRIKEMHSKGGTLKEIADELNTLRVPAPKTGGYATWAPSKVRDALLLKPDGRDETVTNKLIVWAREIGYEGTMKGLIHRRAISAAWPPETRIAGVTWRNHERCAAKDKRHLLVPGITTSQLDCLLNDYVSRTGRKPNIARLAVLMSRSDGYADDVANEVPIDAIVRRASRDAELRSALKAVIGSSDGARGPASSVAPTTSMPARNKRRLFAFAR